MASLVEIGEWRDRRLDKLFGQEDILQKCIDEHEGKI